jgi:phenylacetate-CoA ligase
MTLLSRRERLTYAALSAGTRRNLVRHAAEVRARANWTAAELQRFQLDQARDTLTHAGARVPYYRELFAQNAFEPRSLRALQQLEQLPVLTRDRLRDAGDMLLDEDRNPARLIRMSTGGTTGVPVSVWLDPERAAERMLVNHRMYAAMGRRLGDRTLMIAGNPVDAQAWLSLTSRVKNTLFNAAVRSAFELSGSAVRRILRELSEKRFGWLIAYASVFDILADHVPPGSPLPPGLRIIPCAELVTSAQRERWRTLLGAEVFEIYGSREMSSIAGETVDHRGLLVSGDLYHVEITDAEGRNLPDGTPGLITVTTLGERSMPLLRYQLGDVGALLPPVPEDPHPFRRLHITHGRVLDVICCPDGKLLPGEYFPHLMKEVSAEVKRFQVVQTAINRLEIRIVARGHFGEDTRAYLADRIARTAGRQMRVDFLLVDEIESAASGKFRPTISLLPPEAKRFTADSERARRPG